MTFQEVKWKRSVAPSSEPITRTQAKKQLEISSSDTTHDDHIDELIARARDQVEHDTGMALMTQTIIQYWDCFGSHKLFIARRPVQSISSIQYYDNDNTLQTLSSSYYLLNDLDHCIELAYDYDWPDTYQRWDAVKVTFLAGHTSASLVPPVLCQAMLLLVGYYFDKNRGDFDSPSDLACYERLVARHMRSTYP